MSEPKRELAKRSDKMVEALTDLKETEAQKRKEPISTPRFHELADEVTAKSKAIFDLAKVQDQLGEAAETGDETIDDVSGHGA